MDLLMKKLISVGSDCAGVGSLIQALKSLEIDHVEDFACDFDYFARQSYLANYGTENDIKIGNTKEHKYFADNVKRIALLSDKELSKLRADEIIHNQMVLLEANEFAKKFSFYYPFNMYEREIPKKPTDLYVGSFPCQSFSLAGKRKGQEDKRGILFYCGHEFIQNNKPRYFIIENVKGLMSDDGGKTFQRWIDLLAGKSVNGNPVLFPHENATPYHVYYKVLNAKDFGIPQNRERIFIIGIRDDADNNFNFPKPFHLEKRLKDILETDVDEKYFLSDKLVTWITSHRKKRDSKNDFPMNEDGVSGCITSRYYKTGAEDPYIGAIHGRNPDNPLSRVTGLPTEQRLELNHNGTSNARTTVQKDNVVVEYKGIAVHPLSKKLEFDGFKDGNCPTLLATDYKAPKCIQFSNFRIRKLTPRECARLMSFPDTFTWPVSDSQIYKQMGNSIVVDVLVALIEKLNLK